MTDNQPDLLSIKAAAARLGICKKTVYGLMFDGKLRGLKLGRHTKISRSELDRFIAGLPEFGAAA